MKRGRTTKTRHQANPHVGYIVGTYVVVTLTVIYFSCRSPDADMAEGETAMEVDKGGEDKAGRFVVKKW